VERCSANNSSVDPSIRAYARLNKLLTAY